MAIRSAKNILSYSLNVASDNGGTVICDSADTLPSTNNIVGTHAFTEDTGKLYVWNGSAWYNIALINTNPTITQGADATYSLATDGTPTVITLQANDPEGIPITWSYSVTSGSLTNGGGATATVTQNGNEFTITPSSDSTFNGVFALTFSASDGVNIATSVSDFTLAIPIPYWYGDLATWSGGQGSSYTTNMDYVQIAVLGNATLFGALTPIAAQVTGGVSNGSRGLISGYYASGTEYSYIHYLTFASLTNSESFGSLTVARSSMAGCSDGSRGLFAGGAIYPSSYRNIIDYVTIATTGDATDFGDLTVERHQLAGCSDATYGLIAGNMPINVVTIQTIGNATTFGSLSTTRLLIAACSDRTYGIFAGGAGYDIIDYVTITTPGNATSFGALTVGRYSLSGTSNGSRGVFGGGNGYSNVIDYITITTPGNATDFGDLSLARYGAACNSGN